MIHEGINGGSKTDGGQETRLEPATAVQTRDEAVWTGKGEDEESYMNLTDLGNRTEQNYNKIDEK